MSRIDRIRQENRPIENQPVVSEGSVIMEVEVGFSGGLSVNNARDGAQGAFVVANAEEENIDPRTAAHDSLEKGGHSKVQARDQFRWVVPLGYKLNNTVKELEGGTYVQMSEIKDMKPLEQASKPALVQVSNITSINGRPTIRAVMNVFSPSEKPEDFGIRRISPSELKRAA